MSSSSLSYILANTRLFGRFLLCSPTRKREASFFFDQNARDVESSKGWIGFALLKDTASGRLSIICVRALQVIEMVIIFGQIQLECE